MSSLHENFSTIRSELLEGPKSISDVADKADINWRTAKKYLEILQEYGTVEERRENNTRTFYIKDTDNYFNLPINEQDDRFLTALYAYVRDYCRDNGIEPSETQVQKTVWKASSSFDRSLPIGWYKYGPMCVKRYTGDETTDVLPDHVTETVERIADEYCSTDPITLERRIYEEENDELYQVKHQLFSLQGLERAELNELLMDFIQAVPQQCTEVATDFSRLALRNSWTDEVRECFENVWDYVAVVVYRETLKEYYGSMVQVYLDEPIRERKREAQATINNLIG